MYEMAKTMLVHDVFMFLPLSYEEDEGQSLAFDILEEITRMMDRNDILEDVKNRSDLFLSNSVKWQRCHFYLF